MTYSSTWKVCFLSEKEKQDCSLRANNVSDPIKKERARWPGNPGENCVANELEIEIPGCGALDEMIRNQSKNHPVHGADFCNIDVKTSPVPRGKVLDGWHLFVPESCLKTTCPYYVCVLFSQKDDRFVITGYATKEDLLKAEKRIFDGKILRAIKVPFLRPWPDLLRRLREELPR